MFLAARGVPPGFKVLYTLLGGSLAAGAANALNCYFDRDIDVIMPRTRRRPLASNRLKPQQALIFAVIMGLGGLGILSSLVSLAAAALALGAMAYYVMVYTIWLKRRTYWSSLIGSGAGAFSPLIGWVAVRGTLALTPFLLAAIIILWTTPHFWSLAIFRREEYYSAGLKVLPENHAALWILISSFLMVTITINLGFIAGLDLPYFITAGLTGVGLLSLAALLLRHNDSQDGRRLFFYSIFYMVLIFAAIMVDILV